MPKNKKSKKVLQTQHENKGYSEIPYLHWAAKKNNVNMMRALLATSTDVDSRDRQGETALHYAAGYDCKEAVEFLLAAGADIDAKNQYDETPLYCASKHYCVEVVKILLGKGADASIVSIYGYTPLHWWSLRGNISMVRAVLAAGAGASINVINKYKETALHWAAQHGHKGIVMILLAAGAGASSLLKNDRNKTPINLANGGEIGKIIQNSESELKKMREEKIGKNKISPLDIILASEANLIRYAYDAEVYRWLQGQFGCYDQLYKDLQQGQFGYYNGLIYAQYQTIRRMNLERDASEAIHFLVLAGWKLMDKDSKEIAIADCSNIELERLIATNIDAIYKGETTPLRWAAAKGYREVEKYLLEKSAEVAQPNIQPNTQLDATQIAGVGRYLY
ncbi:ankyrin repeat domain-containing protein [Wolbachia endosymbiont of Pentalonia nigronervosa]|uniref:ankyrin repeat domain-containing protein n=1 Tax=Wolbachia endosymbiont of Pentalonia nigronervosa TaxID=1301914 RepID=UPI00165FE3D0|nr:ankyrin repeat domain-containing protein [Wolbachia endosymbiont of Pentalonia nigronervosa]MBD0391597.1 ankyrin repeat domain-containing protein [Wolbachia endosymbiont of Pentalonia nigronervosa]